VRLCRLHGWRVLRQVEGLSQLEFFNVRLQKSPMGFILDNNLLCKLWPLLPQGKRRKRKFSCLGGNWKS
jgi:hypothetical protein